MYVYREGIITAQDYKLQYGIIKKEYKLIQLKFKKVHEDAILPSRNHQYEMTGDSGYDIYSVQSVCIPAGGSRIVDTGIEVAHITPGYWFKIQGRSGLGFKYGIQPHGGIVDNGYRGNLGTKLYNLSCIDYTVNKGDKIAQLVIYPLISADISWSEQKTQTNRGQKGFGSSDTKRIVEV